jgi:hypothetical protein
MTAIASLVSCAFVGCLGAACASNPGSYGSEHSTSSAAQAIPACTVPAAANTFSATSSAGCQPQTVFQICEVPSGSTYEPDGSISTPNGAAVMCSDPCSATEYSLACTGNAVADSSLGCKVIPLPTPEGATNFCCPCGQ